MIDITGLEFGYAQGGFRLRIDRFAIHRGERVAVIGPSGSGKTTFLHLVAGILLPSTGAILVDEKDVLKLSDPARRDFRITNIGMVFQEFELVEYLSVLDNILLPYRINNSLRLTSEVRQRAVELARQLEVDEKLPRFPGQLSQGERQRTAVCRALIAKPKLILADEPTGNLDPENKCRVIDLLLAYVERHAVTLLTVTHDHGLLDRFGRVVDFDIFRPTADISEVANR